LAQQLDKIFPCLTCKKEIKLARNDTNTGWLRFNLDGTPHIDEKKGNNATAEQIAQLSEEVKGLKETVKVLISQIQILRSDLKKGKSISE
jgi:hypothetical protein